MRKLNEMIERVGMDRVAHFIGILTVTFLTALVFAKVDPGYAAEVYAAEGAIGGVLVAIAKEAADYFDSTDDDAFDLIDLAAGVLGACLGFVLMWWLLC